MSWTCLTTQKLEPNTKISGQIELTDKDKKNSSCVAEKAYSKKLLMGFSNQRTIYPILAVEYEIKWSPPFFE